MPATSPPPSSPADATTLADRAVIRLSGEDVRGFLNGLVTQNVAGPLPVWAGLLTPQGKCLFDFIVWDDGDDLLIDCEASAAQSLIGRLSLYRLRRPLTFAIDPDLAVHWSESGDHGAADPRLAALGRRWLGPAGAPAAGWLAYRLNHGVAEGQAELGDLLWLECNAAELGGVSFTKGCFVGQENTARMNWRAKVNRRLLVVPIDPGQGDGNKRVRIAWPDLGLSLVHARIDAIPGRAIIPDWLAPALG